MQAREQLDLCKTRFYELYSDYLRACVQGRQHDWIPAVSGGDHADPWPEKVTALLRKRLFQPAAWFLQLCRQRGRAPA